MTKNVEKLNALKVARTVSPGWYPDGNGLYLKVSSPSSKCWVFRYQMNRRERRMGLGSLSDLSLAQAREKVRQLRQLTRDGTDPIEQRRVALEQAQRKTVTFDICAERYIENHASSWTNVKHKMQWESTLKAYASPVFGKLLVSKIDTSMVLQVLEPIWSVKTETATRLRERIEKVLSWATIRGYREGENPARWKGHLDQMLPKPTKVKKVEHHAALPFRSMPAFFQLLEKQSSMASMAIELTILTACRTTEVIAARWEEFDLEGKLWIIPCERMKAGREHRVPLAEEAVLLLHRIKELGCGNEWVLPGLKQGRPLSNMAMLKQLQRMGRRDITVHGFRSTFRDWVAETTNFSNEVAEMALAHAIGSTVEAAYRRGDLLEKRSDLMQQWATFCVSGCATTGHGSAVNQTVNKIKDAA